MGRLRTALQSAQLSTSTRLVGAFAISVAVLDAAPLAAQDSEPATALPEINVTNSRLVGNARPRRADPPRTVTRRAPAAPAAARPAAGRPAAPVEAEVVPATAAPSGIVTGTIITGASSTIISAPEIERSPGSTLQDVLAREPGIQVRSLNGQTNGAQSVVDMRGFGAAGTSNKLVLVNGRRLNDIDMAGVDFPAIPKSAIERIEITRGNSGAVLYGDNAVGGVINIVTKSGVDLPPSARIQGSFGSFNYVEGNVSANAAAGPFATSVHANAVRSDGYRENNRLRQQNAVGDFRWALTPDTSVYLNVSGDDQHLGLPGGRTVTLTTSELVTDRRGTATPRDFAEKQGANATLGVRHVLWQGTEVIVDGGVRHKQQTAGFFSPFGPDFDAGYKTNLTAVSLTPRVISLHNIGAPAKLIAGVDVYHSVYDSDRSQHLGDAPIHRYDLQQTSVAGYFMETVHVRPDTDLSVGARVHGNRIDARDRWDPAAPGGAFGGPEGLPHDKNETQYAWHVGIEHRPVQQVALFARAARSFRFPNVDERVGMSPFGEPTRFDLKPQTSHDVEGGFRASAGPMTWQTSVYLMALENELQFSPATFTNTNLDSTRRYGVENVLVWNVASFLRLKGGLAYTRAEFRDGPFKGNDVPLVAPWTASAAVSWDIYDRYLTFDAVVRAFSERRMDNDQANVQPKIPPAAVVDLRIGGEIERFVWSLSVQNVFNVLYYEYAIASTFTLGTYNAYPLPGRTFLGRAGVRF